jgi:hypothetical protein
MDRETRNRIQRATQAARDLLEHEYAEQLEGVFDIRLDGTIADQPGEHLDATGRAQRAKLITAVEHLAGAGLTKAAAVSAYLREAAFTTLNRFVALKMLEARELVQECVSRGEQSAGFKEFSGLAPGLVQLPDHGYRTYVECIFDELSTEVKVLFERRDARALLWPKRAALDALLELLNGADLSAVWAEDETIGWVYQFFNGEDERKQMRAESQAPRNSREMAVRNQFFTPRYVVQFLTDNTLGRIWYEMRGTQTSLAESCEYMVCNPEETFAPRAKKDPRDLRVLDPACGSGHFLLYAFDVLLTAYEEGHADSASPKSEATGRTLAADYPTLQALRKAAPGLILSHNLHGVDIDARCAQIAQLALWMRAQRAYRDFQIGRAERPAIRTSNIVVAEPLVADEELVADFVAKLGDAELGRVFKALVDALKLAGDMGLLLKVETLVARSTPKGQSGNLFAPPEERIRATLARFVAHEGQRSSTRKRLFAEDATQGMGLLAIAEKKYDVVLMNPPFGAGSTRAKKDFEKAYPRTKNDVYAAFVERAIDLLSPRGRVGAITSRTGFFLTSFQSWRKDVLLKTAPPVVFADLGLGVMDAAMVEAAAYCLERASLATPSTVFLRVLDELHDKEAGLRRVLATPSPTEEFIVPPTELASIPGSPFAYWASKSLRDLFRSNSPTESDGRIARRGSSTGDDPRRLRTWWEVREHRGVGVARWRSFAKGGAYAKYHSDVHLTADWDEQRGTYTAFLGRPGRATERPEAADEYFRPGLTWSRRTKTNLSVRVLPAGCIFGDKGPSAFVPDDSSGPLLALLALLNSTAYLALVEFQLAAGDAKKGGAARSYEVGIIQGTPVPNLDDPAVEALSGLARRAWSLKRLLDTTNETSHAFVLPPGTLGYEASPLHPETGGFNRTDIHRELAEIQAEIDDKVFALYGISDEDRAAIKASMSGGASSASATESAEDGSSDEDDDSDEDDSDSSVEPTTTTLTTYSWLVGVAFGRFDPRLATRKRAIPPEPEPFDPLPVRSPGMWPESEQPDTVPPDIMVDDPGHDHDIRMLVADAAAKTGWPDPDDLGQWLAKEFFPLHIKMYSKSRRKAPIYWQLGTPSASYSVWLYIHAFTKDTLFRVQNDYVAPKLAHEQRKLEALQAASQERQGAAERKELAAQESFVEELRAFLDEVKRVAALWNPDLDDGVIINFSLLWRLVPQHKPWQKKCKTTWDKLSKGDYDWAHLAMQLWPERVVPKCAEDRSLAITHGLEGAFWYEDSDGKWQPRRVAQSDIEKLVKERTSAAVKDALKSLLEAPAPATGRATRKKAPRAKGTRKRAASARPKAAANGSASSGRSPAAVDAELLSKVKDAIGSNGDGASKADVIDATGISASDWNKAIKALLADGTVTQTGERRGARYHLGGGDA